MSAYMLSIGHAAAACCGLWASCMPLQPAGALLLHVYVLHPVASTCGGGCHRCCFLLHGTERRTHFDGPAGPVCCWCSSQRTYPQPHSCTALCSPRPLLDSWPPARVLLLLLCMLPLLVGRAQGGGNAVEAIGRLLPSRLAAARAHTREIAVANWEEPD